MKNSIKEYVMKTELKNIQIKGHMHQQNNKEMEKKK